MSNATLNQYKHTADGPVGSAEEQQLELAVNQLAEAVAVVAKTRFDWTEGRRALDNLVHQLNHLFVRRNKRQSYHYSCFSTHTTTDV